MRLTVTAVIICIQLYQINSDDYLILVRVSPMSQEIFPGITLYHVNPSSSSRGLVSVYCLVRYQMRNADMDIALATQLFPKHSSERSNADRHRQQIQSPSRATSVGATFSTVQLVNAISEAESFDTPCSATLWLFLSKYSQVDP